MVEVFVSSKRIQVSIQNTFFSLSYICNLINIEGYYLDHAIGTEDQEEESVDRLWLVARSLKNEQGKYDYKI